MPRNKPSDSRPQPPRWFSIPALSDPLEVLIHPTIERLRGFGLLIFLNNFVSYVIYTYITPQPFENPWLSLAMSLSGLPFFIGKLSLSPHAHKTQWAMALVLWLQLPVMFSFMFVMNDGSTVRMASMVGAIFIYYQVTDWRLATLGSMAGILLGSSLGWGLHEPHFTDPTALFVAISILWLIALFLGFTSAKIRREQLTQAITTMEVMSHEMRPAISTITLIGKALRSEAVAASDKRQSHRIESWSDRLERLGNSLRSTIDSQTANAHLLGLDLPTVKQALFASALVQEAVAVYPYRTPREQTCVRLVLRRDFTFVSSKALFIEVLNNLIRNALRAVVATQRTLVEGDVLIEVGVFSGRGQITVTDRGVGMAPETLERAFEAFFSTDRRAGHGLGLTFCRQIVTGAGGAITAESVQGFGACFTIEFPAAPGTPPTPSQPADLQKHNNAQLDPTTMHMLSMDLMTKP
jgi:two-component system, CAI-1 autoinducer sensor kinase/phosphatase CqsS